jgi:glycosyltransferase involved in cell wall biosynthesis
MPAGLSVLVPTYNNEQTIRRTLESIMWADEILVIDSFSSDRTLEICQEYTSRIVQHEYINSAKQKNWAIPQCRYEWVLHIDSDERLEDDAQVELRNVILHAKHDTHAFRLARKNHVLGVWIKSGGIYHDYQTRLFRRDEGRFEDKEVHAHLKVPGQIETLNTHILHDGMSTISKQLHNIDRYARYQADELRKQGRRFRWYHLVFRPFLVFGYYFFWKRGFMAGYRGFFIAVISATFDFWAHAKLWELQEMGLDKSPL